jgi:hypothetical protein
VVAAQAANGDLVETRVSMGGLGKPATRVVTYPATRPRISTIDAGPYALVFVTGNGLTRVNIYRAVTGRVVARLVIDGEIETHHSAVDAPRRLLYATVRRPEGGLEVRRLSFDRGEATTLVTLGRRFTPDGIPTDLADLVLREDGTAVIEACANDRCRVWQVAPGDAPGVPMRLPRGTPSICSLIGAIGTILVAYELELCFVDYGGAPFPMQTTSLVTGRTRPLQDRSQVGAGRVLWLDGRPVAIAAHRSRTWSRTRIESIDLRTGKVTTLVPAMRNEEDAWLRVSQQVLPGSWVLIEPWGIDPDQDATLTARLLDTETGRLIELPPGTAGWR